MPSGRHGHVGAIAGLAIPWRRWRDGNHVVSAGYERSWAVGERIQPVDKTKETSKLVGVKDSLVESGFNAIRGPDGDDEQLEREWARVEHITVAIVRAAAADLTERRR